MCPSIDDEIKRIRQSGLFDEDWYLKTYPDVRAVGMDPIKHYLWLGAALKRNPSPTFDTAKYLEMQTDVASSGVNPLLHYICWGEKEGRPWPSAQPELDLYEGSSSEAGLSKKLRTYSLYINQVLSSSKRAEGIDLNYVPKIQEYIDFSENPLSLIAFYLPQFHPIPENDEWWGAGFTEWTNVSKAKPQFLGHYQPHLPGELGFYDLRLPDVMRQQAALAQMYGIRGFCFHHYWFGGKRLLERPVNQLLAAKEIDIPFCLCWANENWTRRWDGQDSEILIEQKHSPEDDIAFIDDLIPLFSDDRYIRFQGKPILIVYRVSLLPNAKETAQRWRDRCKEAGIGEIYLIAARSFEVTDPRPYGFDAAVEFPPHQMPAARVNDQLEIIDPKYSGNIYSFTDMATGFAAQKTSEYPLLKTVFPSWDNEARKPGAGHTFFGSSPQAYATWLRSVCDWTYQRSQADKNHPPFVFINAWNEWAEGAHLEPDRKYGYAYLHATANVAREFLPVNPEVEEMVLESQARYKKESNTAVVAHLYYDELFEELQEHIKAVNQADVFFSVSANIPPQRCKAIIDTFPNARLAIFPNRGRDIQPFLHALRFLRKEGYEVACKIHGKRSPQRSDGNQLRGGALNSLLGSKTNVERILARFQENQSLGIIAPNGSLLNLGEPNRNVLNRAWLDRLFDALGMGELTGSYNCDFVAGSMFWFRVEALAKLDELDLKADQFEDELGQVDGTLAHAVERLFAVVTARAGFEVKQACDAHSTYRTKNERGLNGSHR
ncbi:glycoside hydrolase family 99-like domain-containing protein [Breoghania sp.]|uniref:glycoside hydrolase family 99-like domain-containing protein n=1 Tax=Breoghania sp. TaxID=2065378 RepID=UPI002AA6192B|nr:glycoside hydrolase family 99-like domain-containing protein [Breoghania sp.]